MDATLRPSRRWLAALGLVAVLAALARPAPQALAWRDGSELLLVRAGEFPMGSSTGQPDETPPHRLSLPDFFIGRTEVTNAQFARFVAETGHRAQGFWRDYSGAGREEHPVVSVSVADAQAYCDWAGLRLPTEAEWEKAARGDRGRTWPWGDAWDPERANNVQLRDPALLARMAPLRGRRGTLPVGLLPLGASPCGALDMAGNVWEWCAGSYGPYPGSAVRDPDFGRGLPVARGGSWHHDGPECLTGSRRLKFAQACSLYIGFRVAR